MEKDFLEEFIESNRTNFDDSYPSLKIWAKIENELDGKVDEIKPQASTFSIRRFLSYAAAAAVLVGVTVFTTLSLSNSGNVQHPELMAEIEELELHFQNEMNKQMRFISDKVDIPENEMEYMDQAIEELKEDLKDIPKGQEEQVLNTLINIYNSKLMVLQKLSEQIEHTQPKGESIINL